MSFNNVLEDIKLIYNYAEKTYIDKNKKHNYIQYSVYALAKKYNCVGKMEHQIKNAYKTKSGKVRVGYIDVVWFFQDKIILAFEVDSACRYKSVEKLLKVDSKYKVWLCYQKNFKYRISKSEEIKYILPFYNF